MRHLAVAGALAALAALAACAAGDRPAAAELPGQRPNVVVVMTDDQTVSDMRALDFTREHFARSGTSFTNAIATYPLCCPARATFLTGQYAHNHGLWSNLPREGGGFDGFENFDTLPIALQRAGYRTGFAGKYFNGYGRSPRTRPTPRGWDRWVGRIDSSYYGFRLQIDGRIRRYPRLRHGRGAYLTDVLGRQASRFVRTAAGSDKPYFLWLSMYAPHREGLHREGHRWDPRPAVRHRGAFRYEPLPKPPSFDEPDVSDKPPVLRRRPRLRPAKIRELRWQNRARLASLLAVDDAMERLIAALERSGELDNTYLFFTSDNGYLRGEHRRVEKTRFYEESIRVPLYASGPGFPAGAVVDDPVANVDLPATVHALAGAPPLRDPDGLSLLATLADPAASDRAILLENPATRGLRTARFMYAEYRRPNGLQFELYDLERDPYELDSVHRDPEYAAIRRSLAERLDELRDCAGAACVAGG